MDLPLPRTRLCVGQLPNPGEKVRLSREEASHARARRLRVGDAVSLLDGTGREARGLLTRLDHAAGEVLIGEVRPAADPGPEISLFVAGIRTERLSWIAEKATEFNTTRLVIVQTARAQSFRAAPSGIERLCRVAREAAKQCDSTRWPKILGPIPFPHVIADERAFHRFLLDFEADPLPTRLASRSVALLVGPEGGWTREEREAARASGWRVAALPAGKLRTETAALAALVLVRAALDRKA